MNPVYYFDHNATTPMAPEVLEAMNPFWIQHFANPSSIHELARVPARAVKEARRWVAQLLSAASDEEIIFSSGGTESNNAAIRSALAHSKGRKRIVSSPVEHSSVLKLLLQLQKEGYEVDFVTIDSDGQFDLAELEKKVTPQTALVTLMMANNETGALFPIEEAARIAKGQGAFVHVDGVQAAGKIALNLKNSAIDFFSISAHKFYGPKGIGALYVKKGTPFQPLIWGGSQERGRRAGTENVPAIVGLGRAAQLSLENFSRIQPRIEQLRNAFEAQIVERIAGCIIHGQNTQRLNNTSNIRIEGVEAEALLMILDQRGICASAGSACMSGANEPSHVLKAMGLSDREARSAIRISLGKGTTLEEISFLIESLVEIVNQLRNFSDAVKEQV